MKVKIDQHLINAGECFMYLCWVENTMRNFLVLEQGGRDMPMPGNIVECVAKSKHCEHIWDVWFAISNARLRQTPHDKGSLLNFWLDRVLPSPINSGKTKLNLQPRSMNVRSQRIHRIIERLSTFSCKAPR